MPKYAPLADYLRTQDRPEVELSFEEIEKIIDDDLPPTATVHRPYWSNSTAQDGHPGRFWVAAGWRQVRLDMPRKLVTFRREQVIESTLESLRPRTKGLLYDLLQDAGFPVDEWHRTARDNPVENFRSNPRFCYEWSFGSLRDGFALCLWYENLTTDQGGRIVFDGNIRDTRDELLEIAHDEEAEMDARLRAHDQVGRARTLDEAIQESWERSMPVRVIICEGDRRRAGDLDQSASSVRLRRLDALEWYVHAYDRETGACLIVRGIEPEVSGAGDGKDDAFNEDDVYEEVQNRAIKTRRGQRDFRERLLRAYRKRCAVTGSLVIDLLEAAHIVPHSVMTDYNTRNGLLLRADIHTLFDLHLLSVDTRFGVHVSRSLKHTEYWQYHGRVLHTVPELSQDQPGALALEKRHASFLEAEAALAG
ncbi:HNH endonuclease signature motif containing protein [Paraburkholderia sp. J8-2]|uniref:HNH endonuclease n=1 Tax=Paraburkholderia sp. J8-2 TaxID=2805440 RepID=UPI002AB7B4D5|nr:HNH endonuclease signature motif containing protein [Paraburkholderia sp. J8-2]